MDGSKFDAWTRRRVGLATGGAAAALFGLTRDGDIAARKRGKKKRTRKKNRCLRLGRSCQPGGRRCCGQLECDQHLVNSGGGTFCCKTLGKPCTVNDDCCAPNACINGLCQLLN
jgi:hypothetical protein